MEAFQVGEGDELHEVPVALVVAGQQDQVVWTAFLCAPVEAAFVGQVGLAADDGLDAPVLALRVEIDGAVEGAVVGDRQGAHAQLDGPVDQVRDPADSVQHAVLGVVVQVGEHGFVSPVLLSCGGLRTVFRDVPKWLCSMPDGSSATTGSTPSTARAR